MKTQLPVLSLALALCASSATAQTLTTWESPTKVVAIEGGLTKSAGCEGCPDSGAHSTAQLTGDGYVEFVAPALGRLFAGLGADLSAATASSTINYAFSLWPSGAWEIRELGLYKKEGSYAAGDRFRVAVENGAVVYRRNGAIVYASQTSPVYPLGLDVTLYSLGAAIADASVASVASASPAPAPPPPPSWSGSAVRVASGIYKAVTDRNAYAKPALPPLGPAGSTIVDPVFQSTITRITDSLTRPGYPNRSYRTPSSPHQNVWSANNTYFYLMGSGGTGPIPYRFDQATRTAQRLHPAASGDGGFVLKFYIEPQFSYVSDSIIYGSYNGSGSTLRTIDQYDFSTGAYTRLIDLEPLAGGLAGTYVGGIGSSAGPQERIMAFFGGTSQDRHRYVVVFDRANPQNRQVADTIASTINGQPSPVALNFSLHHVAIDRSGRYVMLYTTSADQAAPRNAAQEYLWDLQSGVITELGTAALPYGHDAFGYGTYVNKDCCTSSPWDAGQWQFRSLGAPLATRDLITTLLSPKEIYLSDHTTWNNARPDRLMPVISGTYRFGANTAPWRAWDDEIVAIQTDAPGADPTVWRFAQHRSNVAHDADATRVSFWYQPHPNVSQDGRWVLFTSNWEKTLGIDVAGEPGTGARQDVFLLELETSVSIGTTSLPGGRVSVAYSTPLEAAGGSGQFTWTASGLPQGLSLDATTGQIAGTATAYGSFTVTVSAADSSDVTNAASTELALSIAPSAVAAGAPALPASRATLPYAGSLQATGGTSVYVWSVTAGELPPGIGLNTATGEIAGTPSAQGTFTFTATVADATDAANTASAAYSITIGGPPVAIAAAVLPSGRERVAYAAGALQAAGGAGGFTWSASGLPAGLTMNASTGAIAGTPTTAGTYAVALRAEDVTDATNVASVTVPVVVTAAVKVTSPRTLPQANTGAIYTYVVQAANVQGAAVWNLQGGAPPPGLALSAAGVVTGTPTTTGTYWFNARIRDASTSDTLTLTIVVK